MLFFPQVADGTRKVNCWLSRNLRFTARHFLPSDWYHTCPQPTPSSKRKLPGLVTETHYSLNPDGSSILLIFFGKEFLIKLSSQREIVDCSRPGGKWPSVSSFQLPKNNFTGPWLFTVCYCLFKVLRDSKFGVDKFDNTNFGNLQKDAFVTTHFVL